MKKYRNYNSIDMVKLIMAIFVIAIHTLDGPHLTNNEMIQKCYSSIVGCAVPFFFLSSGFLLGKRMSYPYPCIDNSLLIKSQINKLIKLYLKLSLVYLPLALYEYIVNKETIIKSVLYYIRGLVFVGEHYNSWPLWFLLSEIYALALFLLFLDRGKLFGKTMLSATGVLLFGFCWFFIYLFIAWLFSSYQLHPCLAAFKKLIQLSFSDGRIITGFFYIPFGIFFSHESFVSRRKYVALVFIFSFVSSFFVSNSIIVHIISLIKNISLFLIVLSINLPDKAVFKTCRTMSISFYYSHMWVWTIIYMLFWKQKTYGITPFILTVLGCIVFYYLTSLTS